MIPYGQQTLILELLAAGELSQREIAARLGVSRATVDRLAAGGRLRTKPEESSHRPSENGDIESMLVPTHQCPGCKNMVVLYPCRICLIRQWQAIEGLVMAPK